MSDKRNVIVWNDADEEWNPDAEFKDIKKGNIFLLFEPNGERVLDENGYRVFIAKSDAHFDDATGEWMVDITHKEANPIERY